MQRTELNKSGCDAPAPQAEHQRRPQQGSELYGLGDGTQPWMAYLGIGHQHFEGQDTTSSGLAPSEFWIQIDIGPDEF